MVFFRHGSCYMNVQRLEGEFIPNNKPSTSAQLFFNINETKIDYLIKKTPKFMESNEKKEKRDFVLQKRSEYLKRNAEAFKGNTKDLKEYKTILNQELPKLTSFQKQVAIGLLLGDASIRTNQAGTTSGLTLQQSLEHDSFLGHVREIFLEYTSSDKMPLPLKKRKLRESVTMTVPQFNEIAAAISDIDFENSSLKKGSKFKRSITESRIAPLITPISIAYLFACDGSKASGGARAKMRGTGKGILLHLQSFSELENRIISNAMNKNCGFQSKVKQDGTDKKGNPVFFICLPGSDYGLFIKLIGPYIHKSMEYKVPSGRETSTVKIEETQVEVNKVLGSFFRENPDFIVK